MVEKKSEDVDRLVRIAMELKRFRTLRLKELVKHGPQTPETLLLYNEAERLGNDIPYSVQANKDSRDLRHIQPDAYEVGMKLAEISLQLNDLVGEEKKMHILGAVSYEEQRLKGQLIGEGYTKDLDIKMTTTAIDNIKQHFSYKDYEENVWEKVYEYFQTKDEFEKKAPGWLTPEKIG